MAMLYEEHLTEQMRRVQQSPKCEKVLACPPQGEIVLSEKIRQIHRRQF
jgi:hypothetical protein